VSHTTEVMVIFVKFVAYFAQNLVTMATSLDLQIAIRNVVFKLADNENGLLCNHTLVISCINAFMAIIVPKLVTMVTSLCSLCTRMS